MKRQLLPRKESIIISAIELIDQLGLQGLTTKKIAKHQGITEGAIFKHFDSKQELLLAVLDHFAQYDADIMRSIKLNNLQPRQAIIYFIEAYASFYENYPAIIAISQTYDAFMREKGLGEKIKDIVGNRADFLSQLISQAQSAGVICAEVDCDILSDIILGCVRSTCLRWRINNGDFSLKDRIISAVSLILDGLKPKQ